MGKFHFVNQDTLEHLIATNKATLEGSYLSIVESFQSYHLTPAVKIISCESSTSDPLRILHKFIPLTTLENVGAEIYINSIILKSHSYLIDLGFICDANNSISPSYADSQLHDS